jgi:hypothetical protein
VTGSVDPAQPSRYRQERRVAASAIITTGRSRLSKDAPRDGRFWRAATGDPSSLIRRGFACYPSSTRMLRSSVTGLRAELQLTALAIAGPLGEGHPEQFGTQQHSILQPLLKALRKNAVEKLTAQEPIGATAAAISPEALDSSDYRGCPPPLPSGTRPNCRTAR